MTDIIIRLATPDDIPALYDVAAAMPAYHEPQYFERCFAEQAAGKRETYVACDGATVAGYVFLHFAPQYMPFRRMDIPEVQDLSVIPAYRRRGIGTLLVAQCENAARARGYDDIGIGVAVAPHRGAAQRLYVLRGYVPDGAGAVYDDAPVTTGDMRPVDDVLALKLVKSLTTEQVGDLTGARG